MIFTGKETFILSHNYYGDVDYEPMSIDELYQMFKNRFMDELISEPNMINAIKELIQPPTAETPDAP